MHRSSTTFGLDRLLAAFGCYVLLLSPLVASFYVGSSGDFGKGGVVQYQTYNITWGPVSEVPYVDVYIGQQRDKDDVFLNDRRFEQLLASNVTDMPYVWNVTQPVGTIWALTPVPMGFRANVGSFTGLEVVAAKSSGIRLIPDSVSWLLPALSVSAIGWYLSA